MSKKILISGLLGGVVIFIWGFVSHMVLPLGTAGMKVLPNEDMMIAAMRDNIKETAVYLFPGHNPNSTMDEQMQKREQGPAGFLVYHPNGLPGLGLKLLLTELFTNIISALIAAFLLSKALGSLTSFSSRALFVFVIGFVPFFAIDVSYWNWYGFPTAFSLASLVDQAVGFGLAGLVMAKMMKASAA